MAAFIRKDNLEGAAKLGVMDCVSCGSCSWVCPSHIPLVHYFNYAKGVLNAQERERRKTERTKILAEAPRRALEKAAAAKRAALAARKAQGCRSARQPTARTRPQHDASLRPSTKSGPFAHSDNSVQQTMFTVLLALMPATAVQSLSVRLAGDPAVRRHRRRLRGGRGGLPGARRPAGDGDPGRRLGACSPAGCWP